MTHGPECGHHHQPNPYTDPERAGQYYEVIISLFRIMVLTIGTDTHLTAKHAAMTACAVADSADPIPTFRAMMWELADIVHVLTDGKEPQFGRTECTDPDHDHPSVDDSPDALFGEQTLHAFFAAAAVGEFQSAINVVDAGARDFVERHPDHTPGVFVATMFANAMLSTAHTSRLQMTDPLRLFKD